MERIFSQTFGVVGAILEKDGDILLVRESGRKRADYGKWSHPAGWIDVGEDPLEVVKREVLEESGYDFTPTHLLGVYSLVRGDIAEAIGGTPHAIKLIFIGKIAIRQTELHDDVTETKWFSPDEIEAMNQHTLRDEDIKQMIKDYSSGQKFPLSVLTHTVSS